MSEMPPRMVRLARRWLWPIFGLAVGIAAGFIALGLVQGVLHTLVFGIRPWPGWALWLLGNEATVIAGTVFGLIGLAVGYWFAKRVNPP